MEESYVIRLPKRPQDFNPPACSPKRIHVDPDRGHLPSPHHPLASLQPRPPISRPTSDTEAFLGESQDVYMSDDSLQAVTFAEPSPMDMEDEIVGGEANIREICYGAVRHLFNPKHQSHLLKNLQTIRSATLMRPSVVRPWGCRWHKTADTSSNFISSTTKTPSVSCQE